MVNLVSLDAYGLGQPKKINIDHTGQKLWLKTAFLIFGSAARVLKHERDGWLSMLVKCGKI